MVRRSSFETTALEMPAGFGRIHHHANLARNGWPGPHLRTGDVTLVFTTDEICSNVKLLLWEQGVNRSCPTSLVNLFSRGTSDRSVHRMSLSLRSKPLCIKPEGDSILRLNQAARPNQASPRLS